MTQKPKIQYVGQFYVHGSEAQVLQRQQQRKAKTKLPMKWIRQVEKIYIDPLALVSIAVAVFMLVVMVMGALRIRSDWARYEQMKTYVRNLEQQHAQLNQDYHNSFDLEDIRSKAMGMGMVPMDSVQTMTIRVTPPTPKVERTWVDDLKWFFDGLLAVE